jgi:hypothetical protein
MLASFARVEDLGTLNRAAAAHAAAQVGG